MSRRHERGSVILMCALLLPVVIFVVGLAVDFGIMYAVRNSAQNAADAAAIAGVFDYACAQSGGNCPATLSPYIVSDASGDTAAQHAFGANPFLGSASATLTPSPGGYSCPDALGYQNYCYKLTVSASSPTFFTRVFGKQSVPITVTALAQTNTGLGMGPSCVRPVFVPDNQLISAAQGYPNGCTYTGNVLSCPQGPIQLPNIRPTSPNSGATVFSPSTYYSLDFSSLLQDITDPANTSSSILNATNPVVFEDGTVIDNSGQGPNSPYAQAWYQCTVTALHCGQYVRVQTGLAPTTTTNSVNFLLSGTNASTQFIFPIWDASQTVVNGNEMFAKVVGWAEMENLQCINPTTNQVDSPCSNGDKITATYMTYSACTGGGGNGGQGAGSVGASGSYNTPVRLIRDTP